jgi:hypothetical protein
MYLFYVARKWGVVMARDSERRFWKIKVPRFGYAFALSTLALWAVANISPAKAVTISEVDITFTELSNGGIEVSGMAYDGSNFDVTKPSAESFVIGAGNSGIGDLQLSHIGTYGDDFQDLS